MTRLPGGGRGSRFPKTTDTVQRYVGQSRTESKFGKYGSTWQISKELEINMAGKKRKEIDNILLKNPRYFS